MITVGSKVKVKAPFDVAFPGEYIVESISETGAFRICGDRDFDAAWLELVP